MELKIPSPEQAYWGLRAMKTVAMADGTLDDAELHMLASVQQVFGTTHASEQLSPITPADLAREDRACLIRKSADGDHRFDLLAQKFIHVLGAVL